MKCLSKYSLRYSQKENNKLTIFTFAFSSMVLLTLLLTSLVCNKLPNEIYTSNVDYLTCYINKSEKKNFDNNILSVEKTSKLTSKEITSLSRYINNYKYCDSIEPITSRMVFSCDDINIICNVIPMFSNEELNDTYKFSEYEYNEVLVNETFVNKYKNVSSFHCEYEMTFEDGRVFDSVNESYDIAIKDIAHNYSLLNEPIIYINIDKINKYLDSIILENISNNVGRYYSVLDYLKDDINGQKLNSYDLLIGFKSFDDFKIVEALCDDTILNISSNTLSSYESTLSILEVVQEASKIIAFISLAITFLICIIETYISFLNSTKDLGLLLTLGTNNLDSFFLICSRIFIAYFKSQLFTLPLEVILYFIINFRIINISSFISASALVFYYFFFVVLICIILFICTYLTFLIIKSKSISKLLQEE